MSFASSCGRRRPYRIVIAVTALLAVAALYGCPRLLAQNFPQPLFQAPFSFPNPGARSLGFGGAFLALADDATASFANPAGLVQLLEPEVSLDVRLWDYSTRYTLGGRISGRPTGIGLDDAPGLRFSESNDSLAGLSFLSYVYPKKRWSLAFHRHLQGNFESTAETQGLFLDGETGVRRITDQRTSADFELVTYGVSGGYKVTDSFSFGIGITYFEGSLTLESTTYARDDDSPASLFDPISYLPQRVMIDQVLVTDDTDWGVSAGVLWKISRAWSLGAVYRAAPTFEFSGFGVAGPANTLGFEPGTALPFGFLVDLELPDGYGLGFAYRAPSGRATVSFEWDQIAYADVADSLELDDQVIDDANEFRIGGEYVYLDSTPVLAIRLGAWLDPDHLMRGNGSDPIVDALIAPGDDEMHYAAGLGIAFDMFQIDIGVDHAKPASTVSISAVFSL
jgi:long-subunit fatty acid transport protein